MCVTFEGWKVKNKQKRSELILTTFYRQEHLVTTQGCALEVPTWQR